MASEKQYDVVIVGGGPAGMTAALYTGRAMLKTVLLERGEPGGELLNTEYLDDVIGFPKILGRDLAEKFAEHAQRSLRAGPLVPLLTTFGLTVLAVITYAVAVGLVLA